MKEESHPPGRNPDGTFVKGSEAAKEAGHKGGLTTAELVGNRCAHNNAHTKD